MSDFGLNVLTVIHAPVFGGPHNTMAMMSSPLEAAGVHSIVLLPDEGQAAAARLRDAGVDVITMPLHRVRAVSSLRANVEYAARLRAEVSQIVQLISERCVDVVAATSLPNVHGGLAARRAGIACVWEIVDSFPPPLFRRAWMPVVLKLADVVMTTGRKVADAHPGTVGLGDRWIPFYPCVDVDTFRADSVVRSLARAELGLTADEVVIGNVANLNPMKGHTTFIRAAAELRSTHPNVRFVILGGTYDHLKHYYAELWEEAERLGLRLGIELVVRDPGRRVNELAQAFDLFWMTSEPRSEGLPTVIGEAKALGLPVVTTDVGSTSECVSDGVSGFVVPALEPRAIASAARVILDGDGLKDAMGAAARQEAEDQFATWHGAEAHMSAYSLAVAHASVRPAKTRRQKIRPTR